MKSLFISIIIGLLIMPALVMTTSASEEHEKFLKSLPVKGMVTMIDLGRKTWLQCKRMAPVLEKLEKEYSGKAVIVFINLLEDPEQQYVYRLKALPSQIFFNPEGEEVYRHVGFMSEKDIVAQLKKMGVEWCQENHNMFDSFFLTVNEWVTSGSGIAALGCFLWGVISVLLSPCHLASIPLIVAYVGGQQTILTARKAGLYSVVFSSGLFISIALVGIICALLGRMLGDIGNYWQILIGIVLIWVALGILGIEKCSVSGSLLYRLNFRGIAGAFGLGLAYGILSGSCTFGFIAPVLAIITVQKQIATGILFILLFAMGHCLPIVIAGSSTAAVKGFMENSAWQGAGYWFRKGAGTVIVLLGIYFIINPFLSSF